MFLLLRISLDRGKPDEIYDRIEQLLEGPYIELFARTKRDKWDSWGNEVDKF